MKLKTLKAHYFDTQYLLPGMVYMADKVHGEKVVRNGICEEVAQKKKPVKKTEDKKRKIKLEKK